MIDGGQEAKILGNCVSRWGRKGVPGIRQIGGFRFPSGVSAFHQ